MPAKACALPTSTYRTDLPPPFVIYLPQRLARRSALCRLRQVTELLWSSVSSFVKLEHDTPLEGCCEGCMWWRPSCSYSRTCWTKCVGNQSPHILILLSWCWDGHQKSTFYRKGWGKQLNLSLSANQCFITLGRLGASPPYLWTVQSLLGWKRGQSCKVKWLKRMAGITHGYQGVRADDGSVIFGHQ